MITMDSGIPFQQNVGNLPLAVIILRAPSNDIDDLRPLVPSILAALQDLGGRNVIWIPQ
jgi:hypothetical protein